MFSLRAWQSTLTTSLQVLFGLPLGLGPSASYSMHFLHPVIIFFCYKYPDTIRLCLPSHPEQLIPSAYSTKEPTPTTSPPSFLNTRWSYRSHDAPRWVIELSRSLLLERGTLFRRLFVLRHHCCSSAATSRRHCFSHRTLHHSVWLHDRL